MQPYISKKDIFVDFSCGKNDFAPLLPCKSICYEIAHVPGTICQDWFTVSKLPKNIIIGLNPPFGYQGQVNYHCIFLIHKDCPKIYRTCTFFSTKTYVLNFTKYEMDAKRL